MPWDPAPGLHAGQRAPDVHLLRPGGEAVRLYELLRGGAHVLLCFPEPGSRGALLAQVAAVLAPYRLPVRACHIGTRIPEDGAGAEIYLLDPGGQARSAYGAARGGLRLIRPDGYLGFRSGAENLEANLREYLRRVFHTPQALA